MSKKLIIYCVLLVLIAVFSFLSWQSLEKALFGGQTSNPATFWILPVIMFLIWAVISGLLILLADSLIWPALACLTSAAAFLIIFGAKIWFLIAVIVGFGYAVWASWGTGRQKKIFLKIAPAEILKPALNSVFAVLILIICVILYFSPTAQNLSVEIKVPRPLFDIIINSTGDILKGTLNKQLNDSSPSAIKTLGLSQSELKEIENKINREEVPVNEILDQKTKDELYKTINEQLKFFLNPYKRYLPYGFAIAIFVTLYTIKFIFVWIAVLLIAIIFYLTKKTGLVKIGKEMVEREKIEI